MSRHISRIGFTCPKCGHDVSQTISVPETYWAADRAEDRYTYDHDTVMCKNCYEYFDIEIGNSDGSVGVTLEGYPQLEVRTSNAEQVRTRYDDDFDWEADLPSEPAQEIFTTLRELRTLLNANGDEGSASVFNRMVFSQQVAAMEAYLGDTLLTQVSFNPYVLAKMVDGNEDLKDIKIGLKEILKDSDIVKKVAVNNLRDQLYHNLPKVNELYKVAFGGGIFPSDGEKKRLCKAMPLRHNCVHRNGKDKDDKIGEEPRAAFIRQMEDDLRSLVDHVEAMVAASLASQPTETVLPPLLREVKLEDL